MNEPGFRDYQPFSAESIKDVAEQAKATGRDVQNAAADLASTSAEALKGHASHAVEVAKDLASTAQDRLQIKVAEQKGIGADYVNNFAGAMRQAANHFDSDVPVAGTYMRKAADQIETAAERSGKETSAISFKAHSASPAASRQPSSVSRCSLDLGPFVFSRAPLRRSDCAPSPKRRRVLLGRWRRTEQVASHGLALKEAPIPPSNLLEG